jgi:hypothetical protein
MHIALKTVFAAAAAVVSMAASAQPYSHARIDTPDIDARQARQQERIERGVARGDLTRREARTLQQGQREIARVEAQAKADGRVSRYEMRQLIALLDQADVQIRELRHDRDGRRSRGF